MSLPYDNDTAARLGGTVAVKSGGTWRYADRVWVKKNNAWGTVEEIHVKSGGSWREVGEYNVYHFKFTLNQNNNGTANTSYNYHILNWNQGSNDDYTGTGNITAVTQRRFKLNNALADYGSWNGTTPAIGAIYVASSQRALFIGSMPAGSRVVLYVNGGKRILGKGGNGGNGSNNHSAGGNGQNGQSALWVRTNTTIVNSGQIASGGGGGGGGRGGQCVYQNTGQKSCMKGNQCPVTYQNFSKEQGGGGGGGAGYPGGQGGSGDANGQNGQSNARGNGGQNQSCNAQRGRHGGNLGQNAQGGGTAGSPGSCGSAVDGVSYITYETKGTVNGPEVN